MGPIARGQAAVRVEKTDQLNQFYTTVSWKLALEMRSGKTFEEVAAVQMKDFDSFSECMSREPLQKSKAAPSRTTETKRAGKLNTKSKTFRFKPFRTSWKSNQYERNSPRYYGNQQEDKPWVQNNQDWKPSQK